MHRIWITLGSLFTLFAIAGATYGAVNALAHDEERWTREFAAADVDALDIDSQNGTVEVEGVPGRSEVTVEAEIDHGLRRTSVDVEVVDGRLVVDTDCPLLVVEVWCRVDYRISAPADVAVNVDTSNGRVTVRDIDGPVDVGSSNGTLELARIGGDIVAHSSNGSIEGRGLRSSEVAVDTSNGPVDLSFAEAPDTVVADTSNGPIEIVVPDDGEAYRVSTDSSGFSASVDSAVRTDPSSDRSITVDTSNGPITIRYPTG